jgi:beta-1,4-glucosyltransferase
MTSGNEHAVMQETRPSATTEEVRYLGGYPILSTELDPFVDGLLASLAAGESRCVFFANTNFVMQCLALRPALRDPQVSIVNDGIGMDLAALLVHGRKFASNLNGTDLLPYLCQRSGRPLRLFLLGGKPGVAQAAAHTLERDYGQQVVGTCDGYEEMRAAGPALLERINAVRADVLLVAFGNPLQEEWILKHHRGLRVPLKFGVGALLDFLSGNAQRAPDWVRKLHMEWFYRLTREPRRLLKRYSVDLLAFFWVCLRAGKRPA